MNGTGCGIWHKIVWIELDNSAKFKEKLPDLLRMMKQNPTTETEKRKLITRTENYVLWKKINAISKRKLVVHAIFYEMNLILNKKFDGLHCSLVVPVVLVLL